MITDDRLQHLAAEISAAQIAVRQIESFSARYADFDIESACAVARIHHQRRTGQGAVMVGRKIGFTNPIMWARYGVTQPLWAPLYQKTIPMPNHVHGVFVLNDDAPPTGARYETTVNQGDGVIVSSWSGLTPDIPEIG